VFRQQCFSDARHNTVSATAQSAEGNPLIGRQTATTLLRPCHQIGETNRDGAPSFVDVANYSLRNRILGEYKDVCGIFGRMNDSEFGMVRDPTEVSCDQTAELSSLNKARNFESQWLVQPQS
jgi:hypothetical protein